MPHLAALAAQAKQVLDRRHGISRADDQQFLGRRTDDGLGPGPTAPGVENHLGFVDHRDVDQLAAAHHLDRARDHTRAIDRRVLLTGAQGTRHAARHQAVAAFEREQAQRREVGAALASRQAFKGLVGLAAVGWADKQSDLALGPARDLEAVRVALESQFGVQVVQGVELVDPVGPALQCPVAGRAQLVQRLRRRAFRLQAGQQ